MEVRNKKDKKMRMMMFFIVIVLSSFSVLGYAQNFTGPITMATGGAGRAAVEPSESCYLNPASIVHVKGYHLAGFYASGISANIENNRTVGVAITDNSPDNLFGANVGYFVTDFNKENAADEHIKDLHFYAADFISQRIAIGLGFEHLSREHSGENFFWENNFHIGLLFTLTEDLGLGVVGYNLGGQYSGPEASRTPKSYALGLTYRFRENFHLNLDQQIFPDINAERKNRTMVGLASSLSRWVITRVGAQFDQVADRTLVAFGIGFLGPRLRFDYGFQQSTKDPLFQQHSLEMRLPF